MNKSLHTEPELDEDREDAKPEPGQLQHLVALSRGTYEALQAAAHRQGLRTDRLAEYLLRQSLFQSPKATWPPAQEQR